jgi:hypothetical protein
LLVAVGDFVIGCSQVGSGVDEVDVEVVVIVFLKFCWREVVLLYGFDKSIKLGVETLNDIFILWGLFCYWSIILLFLWGSNSDFLWNVWLNLCALGQLSYSSSVSVLWKVHCCGDEVCITDNKVQVSLIADVESHWTWASLWS